MPTAFLLASCFVPFVLAIEPETGNGDVSVVIRNPDLCRAWRRTSDRSSLCDAGELSRGPRPARLTQSPHQWKHCSPSWRGVASAASPQERNSNDDSEDSEYALRADRLCLRAAINSVAGDRAPGKHGTAVSSSRPGHRTGLAAEP